MKNRGVSKKYQHFRSMLRFTKTQLVKQNQVWSTIVIGRFLYGVVKRYDTRGQYRFHANILDYVDAYEARTGWDARLNDEMVGVYEETE